MINNFDLRLYLLLLPLIEPDAAPLFEELSQQNSSTAYRNYIDGEFIRKLFPIILRKQQIHNLDEVKLLLKKFYSYDEIKKFSHIHQFYMNHLKKITSLFLTHRNGKVALKYWRSKTNQTDEDSILGSYQGLHKVQLWNTLNRMFPVDLLVIMYLLSNKMLDEMYLVSYHGIVALEDVSLDQILSKGLAETHMHLNAGGHFQNVWQSLMSPPRLSTPKEEKTQYIHAFTGSATDIRKQTAQAIVIRILLAGYLKYRSTPTNLISEFCNEFFNNEKQVSLLTPLFHGTIELEDWSISQYNELFEWLQIQFVTSPPTDLIENKQDIWTPLAQKDKIFHLLQPLNNYTTPENIFLFRAVRYVQIENVNDTDFAKLLWRYLRIKHTIFQMFVQGNQIKGLDYFKEFFSRLSMPDKYWSEGSRSVKSERYKLLLHSQLQNSYLRKLEVRISPPIKKQDKELVKRELAKMLDPLLHAYKELVCDSKNSNSLDHESVSSQTIGASIGMLGIIFHFIKLEDEQGIEKCWVDGLLNKGEISAKLYFQQLRHQYQIQMEAIRELREEIEFLSDYIVGIDAAGAEHNLEPWVLAPIYQLARNSSTHKIIHGSSPYRRIKNLGLTYHVGEDFRHLISGLRHIDEVIEHYQFHSGDRIGHAIALGLTVKDWFSKHRVVTLPRMEHLENLLWMWGLHKDVALSKTIDIAYIERQILQVAQEIFNTTAGLTVFNLWKAYQSKFSFLETDSTYNATFEPSKESNNHIFCPYIQTDNMWDDKKLSYAHHCKCYLNSMIEPIHVEVKYEDMIVMEEIQNIIKLKVSREGIIIESNPSSNHTIGEIESLFQHHIQELRQRGLNSHHETEHGIMVTINTDDPIIFNTNINNEYAYIYYALLDRGYAREDILSWIDKVRELGYRTSFIDSSPRDENKISMELELIMNQLKAKYID